MEKWQIKWCKACAKEEQKEQIKDRAAKRAEEGRCTNCGRLKKEKEKEYAWCDKCRETNQVLGRIKRARLQKQKSAFTTRARHHVKRKAKDEEE